MSSRRLFKGLSHLYASANARLQPPSVPGSVLCAAGQHLHTSKAPTSTSASFSQSRRNFLSWPFASASSDEPKTYSDQRTFHWSAEQMFDVVADVAKYSQFVPWCTHSRVLFRNEQRMDAELGIGFNPVQQSYVSHITLNRPHSIKVVVPESSLFHHLMNNWRFESVEPGGCRATFDISFSFKSQIHRAMTEFYFNEVALQMLQVFHDRCTAIYGPPPPNSNKHKM